MSRDAVARLFAALTGPGLALVLTGCGLYDDQVPREVVTLALAAEGTFNPEHRLHDPWPELLATDTLVIEAWRCRDRFTLRNVLLRDPCQATTVMWDPVTGPPTLTFTPGERMVFRPAELGARVTASAMSVWRMSASNQDGRGFGSPVYVFSYTSLGVAADSVVVRVGERVRLPYEGRTATGASESSGLLLPTMTVRSATQRARVEGTGTTAFRADRVVVEETRWVRGLAVGTDTLTLTVARRPLRVLVRVVP
jgi:hypothetical protein